MRRLNKIKTLIKLLQSLNAMYQRVNGTEQDAKTQRDWGMMREIEAGK